MSASLAWTSVGKAQIGLGFGVKKGEGWDGMGEVLFFKNVFWS